MKTQEIKQQDTTISEVADHIEKSLRMVKQHYGDTQDGILVMSYLIKANKLNHEVGLRELNDEETH